MNLRKEQATRRAIALAPKPVTSPAAGERNQKRSRAGKLRNVRKNDSASLKPLRQMTTKCASFGHREFVMYYDDPLLTPDAVPWLVNYLESAVQSGERFQPGETVQIGWMIMQVHEENGALCLHEPDFRTKQVQWVPTVTQTLIDLLMQQLTAQIVGVEAEVDVPNWYQTGIACRRFGEDRSAFDMQRAPGSRENHDSGWFCGCMFVDCDHESMENLRLASLYELAVLNPEIVRYLALPESTDVVVTTDGVVIGRYGKPLKMIAHK